MKFRDKGGGFPVISPRPAGARLVPLSRAPATLITNVRFAQIDGLKPRFILASLIRLLVTKGTKNDKSKK